jgi:ABC-type protease/lipase transport system fused ATPase/permease subunit
MSARAREGLSAGTVLLLVSSCHVDRIAIIGCGGSGKSYLARMLGVTVGITPVHLDGLYYDRDWNPLDRERFASCSGTW